MALKTQPEIRQKAQRGVGQAVITPEISEVSGFAERTDMVDEAIAAQTGPGGWVGRVPGPPQGSTYLQRGDREARGLVCLQECLRPCGPCKKCLRCPEHNTQMGSDAGAGRRTAALKSPQHVRDNS